jgi:hypothetical protein
MFVTVNLSYIEVVLTVNKQAIAATPSTQDLCWQLFPTVVLPVREINMSIVVLEID